MENPSDWKSAVDPSSGRTYWYHRKTRVSTWTKPDFIEPQTSDSSNISAAQRDEPRANQNTQPQSIPSDSNRLGKEIGALPSSSSAVSCEPRERPNTSAERSNTSSEPVVSVRFVPSSTHSTNISNLHSLMLRIADPAVQRSIRKSPMLLTDLCATISSSEFSEVSALALQVLFKLSSIRLLCSTAFQSNQCWLGIFDVVEADNEASVLLNAAIACNLLIGPTALVLDIYARKRLEEYLLRILHHLMSGEKSFARSTIQTWEPIISSISLRSFSLIASKGHVLPALLIMVIAMKAPSNEQLFSSLIKGGIVAALQIIHCSTALDETTRGFAKACLLNFMSHSAHVRETILDCFLDMSFDLSQIATPMGVAPSLYSIVEIEEQRETFSTMMESGCFNIKDATPGELLFNQSFAHRDILWIPRSGTSWKLNSIVLWARCPALRELLQDFWNQGGEVLELSIDANDEVMASVCHYVHGGIVAMPLPHIHKLELLRVAAELGMSSLRKLVETALTQCLNSDNIKETLEFCESFGCHELQEACNSLKEEQYTHPLPSSIREEPSSSVYLKNAIFESLQDVKKLLNEQSKYSHKAESSFMEKSIDFDKEYVDFAEKKSDYHHHVTEPGTVKPKSGGIYSLLLQGSQPGKGIEVTNDKSARIETKAKEKAPKERENIDRKGKGSKMPQEFNADMSLKPQRPKTEAEKRLEEMSKPKQFREPKPRKSALSGDENVAASSLEQTDSESKANRSQTESMANTTTGKSHSKTNKPHIGQVKGTANLPPPSASLPINENIKEKIIPTEDLKALAIPTTRTEEEPSSAVRSSLTLLKNKALKTRRRISVAPVDESHSLPTHGSFTDPPPLTISSNLSSKDELETSGYHQNISRQPLKINDQKDCHLNDSMQIEALDESDNDVSRFDSEFMDDSIDGQQEGMMECPDCGRHFASEPFLKHVRICKKVFVSKRKVFDSSKKRIEAIPELKSLLAGKKKGAKKHIQPPPTKSNWKQQSLAFREAMRAARNASNPSDNVVVEQTPYIDPSLIQCPNCLRRFNSKAAERHIPVCKSIIAKPSTLRKGSGSQASTKAILGSSSKSGSSAISSKKGWN